MSDSDQDQKTHDPTPKRLEDARAKGDVASSPEMRHAAMFVAAIIVTAGVGAWTFAQLASLLVRLWAGADDFALTPDGAQNLATGVMLGTGRSLMPVLLLLVGFALLGGLMQGRPTIAWARLALKWSKLSPASGLKRLFGTRAMVEFAKTLAKISLVVGVALWVVWPKAVALDGLIGADPVGIGKATGELVYLMVKAVALLVGALALADFVYQRRAFLKRMRMSLQEIKDEHKKSEGDPKIKAKIRSIGMQRARKRMMAAVPTASVIVTNPTHYAVALKYEHGQMSAPVVVAKGVDAIAFKIREIATEAKVPVIESPPLARALYASAPIDQPIPVEHYAAVAEIIGYVMRLAKRRG